MFGPVSLAHIADLVPHNFLSHIFWLGCRHISYIFSKSFNVSPIWPNDMRLIMHLTERYGTVMLEGEARQSFELFQQKWILHWEV